MIGLYLEMGMRRKAEAIWLFGKKMRLSAQLTDSKFQRNIFLNQ